jgi:hypothetical protein
MVWWWCWWYDDADGMMMMRVWWWCWWYDDDDGESDDDQHHLTGVSATTGALADNHDVLSLQSYTDVKVFNLNN